MIRGENFSTPAALVSWEYLAFLANKQSEILLKEANENLKVLHKKDHEKLKKQILINVMAAAFTVRYPTVQWKKYVYLATSIITHRMREHKDTWIILTSTKYTKGNFYQLLVMCLILLRRCTTERWRQWLRHLYYESSYTVFTYIRLQECKWSVQMCFISCHFVKHTAGGGVMATAALSSSLSYVYSSLCSLSHVISHLWYSSPPLTAAPSACRGTWLLSDHSSAH